MLDIRDSEGGTVDMTLHSCGEATKTSSAWRQFDAGWFFCVGQLDSDEFGAALMLVTADCGWVLE